MHDLAIRLVGALRGEGVAVPVDSTITCAEAVAAVAGGRPGSLYWAARSTLIRRPEDGPAFDRAFFGIVGAGADDRVEPTGPVAGRDAVGDAGRTSDDRGLTWSRVEVLRRKDLARCTPEERAEAMRLIPRLPSITSRPARRRRRDAHPRPGHPIDLGRTVDRAIRSLGGEIGRPTTTSRTQVPRRLVVLVDVSGSMEPYARAILRFTQVWVASHRVGDVEAFAVGTRLTRITRELRTHDPDVALRRASAAIVDLHGGTRLGEGLHAFNDRWGARGLARGAVVVLLSDGWDRGDLELLSEQMQRVRRVAHRVVWVNPLAASEGFRPTAGGMAAALPFVDELVPGHSISALQDLAAGLSSARTVDRGAFTDTDRAYPFSPPEDLAMDPEPTGPER
jgi:hypothetical protein